MKPEISLISSYGTGSLSRCLSTWPRSKVKKMELYAFMNGDVPAMFHGVGLTKKYSKQNALTAMAEGHELSAAKQVASNLNDLLRTKDVKIIALASFLPELMAAEHNTMGWPLAQAAVQFLIQLGVEMNLLEHEVKVVEIVCGSAVDGVWRGKDTSGNECFVVNRVNRDAALERLARRLEPIAKAATQARIPIALELEPGPLFTLGDWEALVSFAAIIEGNPVLNPIVGFNLDIAHWALLSKFDPAVVRRSPSVFNRIVHAHVSDHSCGHLSDAVPTTFNSERVFAPWIQLLIDRQSKNKQDSLLQFSGYMSCELECLGDVESMTRAIRNLVQWNNRSPSFNVQL